MKISVNLTDNSSEIMAAFNSQIMRALNEIGAEGVNGAIDNCNFSRPTGKLAGSIKFEVVGDNTVYVGTNTEHGAYMEFGTGKFCTLGGGRPDPWRYMDEKGDWHRTEGNVAKPFLKPGMESRVDKFREIIEEELRS